MDIDLLKSVPEDQMEMMLMTWQMDKFPELSAAYADHVNEMHSMEASPEGSSCTTNNSVGGGASAAAQFLENSSSVASPTFMMNQPSTISFGSSPADFLSNLSSGCWGNDHLVGAGAYATESDKRASMAAMREMIFRIAAMQPIHIDPESVKPPKRRNVKISNDPQSVAARHRRERISERIRILQRLVPGGTKMDTASMLDEAIHYVKFLKNQVQSLERAATHRPAGIGFPVPMSSGSYLPMPAAKNYHRHHHHHHHHSSVQKAQHFADA